VKNITVSVDEETYRRARIVAAERDTSVSGLVKEFLNGIESKEARFERLLQKERALRESITDFDAQDRLSRDELHERRR
jgi:hypothetical protein